MARLGTLTQFQLDHLDLRVPCIFGKTLRVERTVIVAAAKVAGTNFPDQVAPVDAVVAGDGTFTCVVRKASSFGTRVECQNGVGAQGPKTHGRDIEHAGLIGLCTACTNRHPKVLGRQLRCDQRVVHPFIALGIHRQLRAEGALVRFTFGALVDQGALRAREGHGLCVTFNEVLSQFGPHELHHVAQVPNERIVA